MRIAEGLKFYNKPNTRVGFQPRSLQQINSLTDWFTQRAAYKEKALTQRGLTVQAGEHSEQILPAGGLAHMTVGRYLNAVLLRWRSCAGEPSVTPAG